MITNKGRYLAVAEHARGLGVAGALLTQWKESQESAAGFRVWTGKSNVASRRLYEKHGFAPDGFHAMTISNNGGHNG